MITGRKLIICMWRRVCLWVIISSPHGCFHFAGVVTYLTQSLSRYVLHYTYICIHTASICAGVLQMCVNVINQLASIMR